MSRTQSTLTLMWSSPNHFMFCSFLLNLFLFYHDLFALTLVYPLIFIPPIHSFLFHQFLFCHDLFAHTLVWLVIFVLLLFVLLLFVPPIFVLLFCSAMTFLHSHLSGGILTTFCSTIFVPLSTKHLVFTEYQLSPPPTTGIFFWHLGSSSESPIKQHIN